MSKRKSVFKNVLERQYQNKIAKLPEIAKGIRYELDKKHICII